MKSKPQSPLNDQYIILVESYLEKCKAEGNCEWTLTFKRKSCEEFLIEMINRGKDLSTLDAAAVGNISINMVNRNKWHVYRMFLHFLFEKGSISKDLSIIVPTYREKQPLPAVYSRLLAFMSFQRLKTLVFMRLFSMVECSYSSTLSDSSSSSRF